MLISGDLTLPDGLTPQQFLAKFFNIGFSEGDGYANIDAYSEDGKFIVSTLFDTIPGLTNGFVELTFSSSPLNTTTNAFREIQSIAIVDNDTGTRMDITLIQPVTFAAFSGEFDVGGGLEGFLNLLMPLTGPGFFLNHDGSPGDDYMEGFSTNDFLNGRFGNDFIFGRLGNDSISGGEGDDTLNGGGGEDTIDGGGGTDTAQFQGNQSSYTLAIDGTIYRIQDRAIGGDLVPLISVEVLDFEESSLASPFDLTQFGGTASLSAQDFENFIELYIAYFNRAPDAVGLNFWGTAFANGTTLEQMATLFVDQDETRATYPEGTSSTDFVTAVYDNVLGRIPDLAGFDFWVDMLIRSDVTGVTRDQFILEVLRGVQDGSPDRAYLDSKVDIGAYFAVHKGMSDVGNASAAMALFDGSQGSIDNAVAAIDGYYQDALDPTNGEFLMQVVGVLEDTFSV